METNEFLKKIKRINHRLDADLIQRAAVFAQKTYQDQKRISGQTYFDHCLEVAMFLTNTMKSDSPTVAAAILHEVLERTNLTKSQLKKAFGHEIAYLVEGVTNVSKVEHHGAKRSLENLRKLFLAMAGDIRVILIKLVNRLHGFKTLDVFPPEKRKRIALETLEIYAPLAHRLGMGELKGQLEDLAFTYVYPQEYQSLMVDLSEKYRAREKYLNRIQPILEKILKEEGIKFLEIHRRAKYHYSLYKKLLKYEMDWDKIYDLVALRIIVPDIESCYATIGIIHKQWKPLVGRIKDFIAMPKPNGYQSLHTTVFCQEGKITEFQIRTPQMHREAEYGIAAHWYYDEKKGITDQIKKIIPWKKIEEKKPISAKDLAWVKQLQEWQKEKFSSPEEFLESLRIDFFKDRIFIFTPKGDVIDLPEGATPIDFAYHIHTDIGHHCAGAKIDGKLSSFNQPLQNGQVVEIIIQKNKKPSQDWLKLVKTSQAKSKIRAFFKKG